MIDSVGARPNLRELGTRYDHYMELKEVFLLGMDVIERMNQSFVSDADRVTKLKLSYAVEMINKRLDYLSDFVDKTSHWSSIAREVNDAGIHRTLELGGNNVKPKDANQSSGTENPST